ncbi:MAG TPA: lipopolysaccharide biosynthesis protein [Spirochaetota bacterium]|nr:lipopolysaccharide biosynthesis protein [Spirochaetota bacterium]
MNIISNLYNNNKSNLTNLFWRSLQTFGKEGISSLTFFICAVILSSYNFGIFSYILSIISLLIIFSDFGISGSITKFVSEYNVTDKEKIKTVIFNSIILILIVSIIISFITIIFGKNYLKENYFLVICALPMALFIPLCSLFDGVFRGLKKFKQLSIISLVIGALSIFIILILIKYFNLIGALLSRNIYYILLFFALIITIRSVKLSLDFKILSKIVKYSTIIGITSLMFFLYTKADILILKHFGYILEIGYYEIIIKLTELLILPFIVFGQVIAPNITEYFVKGECQKVKTKALKHIIFSIVFSAILTISFYFILPFIIKSFFLKYYNESLLNMMYLLLLILPIRMIGQVVNNGYTLSTGNAGLNMITMIPAGILNVLLDIIFIKYFGYIGVIYSTMICFSFGSISLIIMFFIKLNKLIMINRNKSNES